MLCASHVLTIKRVKYQYLTCIEYLQTNSMHDRSRTARIPVTGLANPAVK